MAFELLFVLALVILNGVFSMSELAVVSSRKPRLAADADAGDRRAAAALRLSESPHSFLSTVQVGITLIGILAGVYGGATIAGSLASLLERTGASQKYSEPAAYAVVVFGITYLSLVVGELLPKRLALAYPEQIAKILSPTMEWLSRIFAPGVKVLEISTDVLYRLFALTPSNDAGVTHDEITDLLAKGRASGTIEDAEEVIAHKVFRLGDRSVQTIMTPRSDIVSIELSAARDEIWGVVERAPHSTFVVHEDQRERIVGVVSLKNLALAGRSNGELVLRDLITEPLKVPFSATLLQLLEHFRATGGTFAIVIDEFGGVDGVVTLHDLTEAMLGTLGGEPSSSISSSVFDGLESIEEIAARFGMEGDEVRTPEGYSSLSGFVMARLGRVPVVGEGFEYEGYRFKVLEMSGTRIRRVRIAPEHRGVSAAV